MIQKLSKQQVTNPIFEDMPEQKSRNSRHESGCAVLLGSSEALLLVDFGIPDEYRKVVTDFVSLMRTLGATQPTSSPDINGEVPQSHHIRFFAF